MTVHHCKQCARSICASKVPIFSKLNHDELIEIVQLIAHRDAKHGDMLFLEGDTSDALLIINHGQIKLFKYTKEGKEQILHILGEGDFFGELSLLKEQTYTYNAMALSDVKLCLLSRNELQRMLEKNPSIAQKILEEVGQRLIHAEALVQKLATQDVESRIAGLLWELQAKYGHKTGEGVELDLPLTREDLANFVGVARETISRKLHLLQQQGIILLEGRQRIIIKHPESLLDI